MKHLFQDWSSQENIFYKRRVILFLDYDGTLVPIRRTPAEARISLSIKHCLKQLAHCPRSFLVIISGRSRNDVKAMIEIPRIIYIGNHGLESPGIDPLKFGSLTKLSLRFSLLRIKKELESHLKNFPGAWIEDKGRTLSLHYRQVLPGSILKVKRIFRRTCSPYIKNKKIIVSQGKKVLEIRPPVLWGKGHAVEWIISRLNRRAEKGNQVGIAYLGDDATDEEAFCALQGREDSITVCVGQRKKTCAQYYVEDQREVLTFLTQVLQIRKEIKDEGAFGS